MCCIHGFFDQSRYNKVSFARTWMMCNRCFIWNLHEPHAVMDNLGRSTWSIEMNSRPISACAAVSIHFAHIDWYSYLVDCMPARVHACATNLPRRRSLPAASNNWLILQMSRRPVRAGYARTVDTRMSARTPRVLARTGIFSVDQAPCQQTVTRQLNVIRMCVHAGLAIHSRGLLYNQRMHHVVEMWTRTGPPFARSRPRTFWWNST